MGLVAESIKKRETGRFNQQKSLMIREHFSDMYSLLNTKENPFKILNKHQKFINSLQINNPSKHHTLIALKHFCNTKDKNHAMVNLTQYANNRRLF